MTTTAELTLATSAVTELQRLRDRSPVGNRLLDLAEVGGLTLEHLRRLVGIELQCHGAELAAYGTVIARFSDSPVVGLYLDVARLVYDAHPKLLACVRPLGMDPDAVGRWPSGLDAQAFGGCVSWLALHGGQADNALALHTDMTVYFPGCQALLEAVRKQGLEVPAEFVSYYEGGQSDELERRALEVVEYGLRHGEDRATAIDRARRLEEHIGSFWKAAARTGRAGEDPAWA
ncbi:hypothetical protein [Streptosporangium saharense]|uniref:hypothetical protein n=1 Tax=Streptosporangium saharense TaxID=1706840 RepID=UPI00342AD358